MAVATRLNVNGNLQVGGILDEITNNPSTMGSFNYTTVNNYLSVPSATAGSKYDFGTGDFTVECWVYGVTTPSAASGYNLIMASANTLTWELLTYNSQLYWHQAGGNFLFGGSITYPRWNHFAEVRLSGTLTLYINGVSIGSKADSYSYAGQATRIFGPNGGTAGFYMTNIRIVNGTAVYTKNFVPPGNPLTASTNTAILLLAPVIPSANSFTDSSTNNVTLTKTGTVNIIQATPFTNIGSNVSVQRVTSTGTLLVTGIFDEYTIQGSGVAQRINPNGNLQVGGFFDEYNKPV